MDLLKSEVGSSNNTCGTSALDGNSVASIDAEMVSRAIEEEEDQDQTTNPSIKTEPIESSMAVVSVTKISYRLYRELPDHVSYCPCERKY